MKLEEEYWCVGCGWDQYGDFEQQQAAKFHANENPVAKNLQQVRFSSSHLFATSGSDDSSSIRLVMNKGWPLSGRERVTEARFLLRLLI